MERPASPVARDRWQTFIDVGDFWAYTSKASKVLCAPIGYGNHYVRIIPKLVTSSILIASRAVGAPNFFY